MNIEINIDDNKIRLILKKRNESIDEMFWFDENDLSQKLLLKIDSLLNKNKLLSSDIEKMKVKTEISEKFTTVRIAKVVAKTFNFSNKNIK